MTFTRDNIVGVEFTVNKIFCLPEEREVEGYKISWCDGERECIVKSLDGRGGFHYPLHDVLHYLNNGTWIVKNSKV